MFEQERFIGRLQRHVLAEEHVVACFLSGSFGRRADDAFSDVDIALVYDSPEEREAGWAARREFAKAVMPYVAIRSFDAAHVRPYFHVALYSNGTKADYRFETRESLSPNPGDRELRILKDTDRWAEGFAAASARLAPPQPYISPGELTDLDDRFWVMYWDVLRLLRRGDLDKPFTVYLQLLHFTLPPLLAALPPEEPARAALLRAVYSGDAAATLRGVSGLLDTYLAARAAVIRRQNLVFPINTAFEGEIRRLAERVAGR
ncbi:hypothetical protein [Promineifilum sp.]|uniref:nucleotidyltransferase domain-containing protein n=1 Tax=Promineifilum sp. TaxID=2664178 RepID=UPI0035B33DB3